MAESTLHMKLRRMDYVWTPGDIHPRNFMMYADADGPIVVLDFAETNLLPQFFFLYALDVATATSPRTFL
jgi:hypothetical protein